MRRKIRAGNDIARIMNAHDIRARISIAIISWAHCEIYDPGRGLPGLYDRNQFKGDEK